MLPPRPFSATHTPVGSTCDAVVPSPDVRGVVHLSSITHAASRCSMFFALRDEILLNYCIKRYLSESML